MENQLRSRHRLTYVADTPPDDYRYDSVLPTIKDLHTKTTFVRPALLSGGYEDKHHYFDVQFRLLKQDFVIPLREGIQQFKQSGMTKHFNSSDLRLYYDVHILGIVTTYDGIDHVLKFDTSKLKSVKWDFSKRLIFGALVCLSKDGFQTIAMATISNRDAKALKYGHINVHVRSGLDLILNSTPDDEFVMAETVTFYEAYCHVLEGLQTMDNLPFDEHIVYCETNVEHPRYLLRQMNSIRYDLTPLMMDRSHYLISNLLRERWPPSYKMCLNDSQREAAQLALTKRLAIIQGPPGTGKTYVGLKVVETILLNRTTDPYSDCEDPILVVCYTNHALDQFLEGILDFCNDIIRVGGQSKSTCMDQYNLKKLRKANKFKTRSRALKDELKTYRETLRYLGANIVTLCEQMEQIDLGMCSYDTLRTAMRPLHQHSLLANNGHEHNQGKASLKRWLNLKHEDPQESVAKTIEISMTRLILSGQFVPQTSDLSPDMPIEAKATFYLKLVAALISRFEKEGASDVFHYYDDGDSNRVKIESCRQEIVPDQLIRLVLPNEQFYKIYLFCPHARPNFVIKTWLLGLDKNLHQQLNDMERLKARAYDSNAGVHDDLVLEDVQRTAIDDEDDLDKEYVAQTNALRNSFTSVVQRLEKLRLDEDLNDIPTKIDTWQQTSKPLSYTKLRRQMRRTEPLSDEREALIQNVWSMSSAHRFSLYKLWLRRCKREVSSKIEDLVRDYQKTLACKKEADEQQTISILQSARVIGMTTTGAAKYRSVLQRVGCRIIVVEEAAEVLEAHIVTALNKQCEHLILIGDHQQLRPSPGVYELETKFGLGISLFERLINNQFPFVMLQEQHRMRPEISKIMRHIYPDLRDHPDVSDYERIQGVSKNVFFIQHSESETSVADTKSKSNTFEASYATQLCSYLLLQGYAPSQITILATYTGQVLAIKNCMRSCMVGADVRVTSVDNFQGEENDVIILSLVRSNEGQVIGFLKVDNRVCVALSRAKKGLFIIGNFELLSSKSTLWSNILRTAQTEGIVGDGLPVECPNHPDRKQTMSSPSDFESRPFGGCGLPCTYRLRCGHVCGLTCHALDRNHEKVLCTRPCRKLCSLGHRCQRKCSENCGLCLVKTAKVVPACGHTTMVPCSTSAEKAVCDQACESIYRDCGHQCSGVCGDCRRVSQHPLCRRSVQYTWPCGHTETVECHKKPSTHPCPHSCDTVLDCGHKCKGSCSKCLQGAVHAPCEEECGKKLPCGHRCRNYCGDACSPCPMPCPTRCRHGACSRFGKKPELCGHICIPCTEPCMSNCRCKSCSNVCSECCSVQPCNKRCTRTLQCGHPCCGICGELCVCRLCSQVHYLNGNLGTVETTEGSLTVAREVRDHPLTGLFAAVSLGEKQFDVGCAGESGTRAVLHLDNGRQANRREDERLVGERHSTISVAAKQNLAENAIPTSVARDAASVPIKETTYTCEDDNSKERPKTSTLFKVPTCDHVFLLRDLDKYIKSYDPQGSSFIPCPVCQTPIQRCNRYQDINSRRAKIRKNLKLALIKDAEGITLDKTAANKKLAASCKLVQSLEQRHPVSVHSTRESLAQSFKIKLVFVLDKLESLKHDGAMTETLSNLRGAVLAIGKHFTTQHKREVLVEVVSCLSQAVSIQTNGSVASATLFMAGYQALQQDEGLYRFLELTERRIHSFLERYSMPCDRITTCVRDVFHVLRSSDSKFLCEIFRTPPTVYGGARPKRLTIDLSLLNYKAD